jgi:hypothetical protein
MTKEILTESVRSLPKGKDGVYRVRIIQANVQGSSGFYEGEMLEAYGPPAFPAQTLSHIDHPTLSEREDRPERSVLTLGGYTVSEPTVEPDGLYVDMFFAGKAREVVENFGAVIGLSIRAQGDIEESERDGQTIRVVKAIYPSPLNSIDLVTIPGAGGKIIAALEESLKVSEAFSADNGKVSPMEIQELAEKVDALAESLTALTTLLTPIAESLKPEEAPEVDVVEAVRAAGEAAHDLPKDLRDVVIEAVKADPTADVAALVAKQNDLVESIRETIVEAEGFILGGSAPKVTNATELGKVL